ncbi:hypothetical protein A9168_02095 [Macellibacteroides sp. HH-ZS]|nr:hypothetical protein A9168_02095 [Macellibacteroides sp. HH-ZS]
MDNEHQKLVSVIIPVYNNAEYLQKTLDSLGSQTYEKWEAICVDDGSNDGSQGIILQNASFDNRIHFIQRDELPKGGSHCRNIGARHAKGDYIIFLDGDDILTSTCIKNRLDKITPNNYDFVVFPMGTFRGDVYGKAITDSTIKDYAAAFASCHAVWQVTSPLYRHSFFNKIGGFDTNFARLQDVELGLRAIVLSNNNFKTYIDEEVDCFYRLSNSAVNSKKYYLAFQQYEKLYHLVSTLQEECHFASESKIKMIFLSMLLSSLLVKISCSDFVTDQFDFSKTTDIVEKLSIRGRILYKIADMLYFSKKIQSSFIRIVRRSLFYLYY